MAAKTSQGKLDYIKEYDRENKRLISVKLNRATEPELVEYWDSIPNKRKWFTDRLRADMEASKKAGK